MTLTDPVEHHPAASLFPLLPEDELADLAEDIRANGLLEPIWTHGGKLLDGRNRLAACRRVEREVRQRAKAEKVAEIAARPVASIPEDRTYPVLYVDPPWRYEHVETDTRKIENHYPTMTAEDLASMKVPAADDAVIFMWATSPKLQEALDLLKAWGFDYRTCAVWVKDRIGMGYYFRQRHELLLVARRGSLPVPGEQSRPDSVIEAPRTQHSAKPTSVYELIETMYPSFSRLELSVHDFTKDLSWSHDQAGQPWWEEVYRKFFGNRFASMHDQRPDGWAQRAGIDRLVILTDATVIKVDEKVRRRDYGDILLEYDSTGRGALDGWMEKPLSIDFIAYAFEPSRRCYLLPYQSLKSAWDDHKQDWFAKYGNREARNRGYSTFSVPVPIPDLLVAITDATCITWSEVAA